MGSSSAFFNIIISALSKTFFITVTVFQCADLHMLGAVLP